MAWTTFRYRHNNDGWLDLFVANDTSIRKWTRVKGSAASPSQCCWLANLPTERSKKFSKASGLAGMPLKSRAGAAFGDIANNGNIDIVVLNVGDLRRYCSHKQNRESPCALPSHRNKKQPRRIGARITIHAGGMMQSTKCAAAGVIFRRTICAFISA